MKRSVLLPVCLWPAFALCCAGCNEGPQQADPEAIRRFEEIASRPTGSATPTAAASPTGVAGVPADAVPSVPRPTVDESKALTHKLVYQASALLDPLAPRADLADTFAAASWHLARADRSNTADAYFRRARRCLEAATGVAVRVDATSRLIAACGGGGHDADYAALLIDSDRLFDELTAGSKNVRETETRAAPAFYVFFRSLVHGGRYEEALRRIEALHTPKVRFASADAVIRLLFQQERPADVRRCLNVMRDALQAEPALSKAPTQRALCSAYALADNLAIAEQLYRELSARFDGDGGSTFATADYLPAIDLAAARKRQGDATGCTRLWETDLAPLIRSDPAAAIVACAECDEFETAAAIVVAETDAAMIPRLAALLCRAAIDRGRIDDAWQYADRFKRFAYPSSENLLPTTRARRFDDQYGVLELAGVVPLLMADEPAFSKRIDGSTDALRSRSLLRGASLLWKIRDPRYSQFVPDQETTCWTLAFLTRYP
jgi:hypothetical protein